MMEETCECKRCKRTLVYKFLKAQGKNLNKIYIDDKGRQWKAKTCPDCQAEIRRLSKKPRP